MTFDSDWTMDQLLEAADIAKEDEEAEDARLDADESFGFGVCVRRTCIEPCGPNGGCTAGRRRWRSEP
jgi:hypothetical protein